MAFLLRWNPGAYAIAFPAGTGMVLLFDGAAANGYVYQSLGTVTAAEIAVGTMMTTADFVEKSDDPTVDATFDVYLGAWGGAADGFDIGGAGLTSLFGSNLQDWGTEIVDEVTGPDADAIQAALPAPDAGLQYHTFRTEGSAASNARDFMRITVGP